MNEHDRISSRFAAIEKLSVPTYRGADGYGTYCEIKAFNQWACGIMSLLQDVFGEQSTHFIAFKRNFESGNHDDYHFLMLMGIFQAAKSDFENGFVQNLEATISGEILGDFVKLAKEASKENQKDVAAVLAAAALEDALKRYATLEGLDVLGKTMDNVVSALKAKGLIGGAQKSLLETMPKIRNYAMHADWGKLSPEDVSAMIAFVEMFLISKF